VAAAMAAQQNTLPLCSEYAAIAQSAAETGQEPQVIQRFPRIPEKYFKPISSITT